MPNNGMLLSPDQHALLRTELVARATTRIVHRLLEGANGPQEKADARMDARLLAGRIADDFIGLLTPTPGAAPITGKPSLAALIAAVK